MAVKRGKKQARRKDEPAIPGVVWLLAGLLIGGAVAVALWLRNPHAVDDLLPHPNAAAKPKQVASAASDVPDGNPPAASPASTAAASPATPKKPRYDFYTLLPEREVVIPDDELKAQVKAEASNLAAKQQAALAAAASNAGTPGATTPLATTAASPTPATAATTPVTAPSSSPSAISSSANATAAAKHPTASTATSPATPSTTASVSAAIPVPAAQLKSGEYLLQAGAFRNTQQADDLKARIAMLGLVGRVETVQTAAGEMHRVRLGPYATASELEAAKQKLSGGGLPAIAVRVK
ncbi:MAG: SPOR domain-containing protein [Proteobacteria bacterium]|nr:SPOR domain-containing protein [Pseudomonadota bacterium]